MKEGAPGASPNLQVFEFGPLESKRNPSDILPYLPIFRSHFSPLATSPHEMTLKTQKIPLADVECVTSTLVKMGGPTWYLNIRKGQYMANPLCCEPNLIQKLFLFRGLESLREGVLGAMLELDE